MKKFWFLPALLLVLPFAATQAQERNDTLPGIRFEARCAPDSPNKSLVIVNDRCYYLVAPKAGARPGVHAEDYGVEGEFGVRYCMTASEEGQALRRRIPREYDNGLTAVILKIYQR